MVSKNAFLHDHIISLCKVQKAIGKYLKDGNEIYLTENPSVLSTTPLYTPYHCHHLSFLFQPQNPFRSISLQLFNQSFNMQSASFMPSIRNMTAKSAGMQPGATVALFAIVQNSSTGAGTAPLQHVDTLRQTLHSASFPSNDNVDMVPVRILNILVSSRSVPYFYFLPGMIEQTQNLGGTPTASYYMCNSRSMVEVALPEDVSSFKSRIDVSFLVWTCR